jgi:hypothetical protein
MALFVDAQSLHVIGSESQRCELAFMRHESFAEEAIHSLREDQVAQQLYGSDSKFCPHVFFQVLHRRPQDQKLVLTEPGSHPHFKHSHMAVTLHRIVPSSFAQLRAEGCDVSVEMLQVFAKPQGEDIATSTQTFASNLSSVLDPDRILGSLQATGWQFAFV